MYDCTTYENSTKKLVCQTDFAVTSNTCQLSYSLRSQKQSMISREHLQLTYTENCIPSGMTYESRKYFHIFSAHLIFY